MGQFVPRPGRVTKPWERPIVARINELMRGVHTEADWQALTPIHRATVMALVEQLEPRERQRS